MCLKEHRCTWLVRISCLKHLLNFSNKCFHNTQVPRVLMGIKFNVIYLKVRVKNCDPIESSANNSDQVPQMFSVMYSLT